MSSASRISLVNVAKGELGVKEPTGDDKYIKWYNSKMGTSFSLSTSWCAIFVSWCANAAKIPETVIQPFAACKINQFKSTGAWHGPSNGKYYTASDSYKPQTGDLIFFNWSYSFANNGCDHVGIVESYNGGDVVTTIEGNTSSSSGADGVYSKSRTFSSKYIVGFASPNYDGVDDGNVVMPIPEGDSIPSTSSTDSPLVGDTDVSLATLLEGYEILPNLDAQPYYAFVDLSFGGHKFPAVPPDYLQNLTIQDVGPEGATISMVLLDKYGDEIEELLYRSVNEENYVRFGHITGRQSKLLKFKLLTYNINFESVGTVLTISGISTGAYEGLSTDNVFSAGDTPSKAVKAICDKLGYQYDDTTIQETNPVILSDGTVKEFNLIRDNLIDYIHKEISPYAVRSSDGQGGYQFYIDEDTTPPTAYFHPIEVSDNVIRTYIYQKGLNTTVISFDVSSDFVISGEGATGITSVLESNIIDPITKEESTAKADINDMYINVNGEYSHIESNQSTELVNPMGNNYGAAVSNINYRMTISQKTFNADLTIVGDPTIKVNNMIRILILTKENNLHHCSGLYLVNGVSHSISSGIMITTLNVIKSKDIDGVQLKSYKTNYK